MVLVGRESGCVKQAKIEGYRRTLEKNEDSLRRVVIEQGLEAATFTRLIMVPWPCRNALPTTIGKRTARKNSVRNQFVRAIDTVAQSGHLVMVLHGIDGLCCVYEEWLKLQTHFSLSMDMKISLLIGESLSQWIGNENIIWSYHDWIGPINQRFWLACDLDALLTQGRRDEVRVYSGILEQWGHNKNGRDSQ